MGGPRLDATDGTLARSMGPTGVPTLDPGRSEPGIPAR